jgi:hypothetical protein
VTEQTSRAKAVKGYFAGDSRFKRLLGILIALVISDGVISYFGVSQGLAREGNPFLQTLVGEQNFLLIKVAGALLGAFILWDIHKTRPRMARISSYCFVGLYTGIVVWNLFVLSTA